MNDISVKIVVSPKEEVNCVDTPPVVEVANENDVDPLALDGEDISKEKDPLCDELEVKNDVVVKTENCDEYNAKEVNIKESQDDRQSVALQLEKIKGI